LPERAWIRWPQLRLWAKRLCSFPSRVLRARANEEARLQSTVPGSRRA
jgi:hypothetical protein